MRIFYAVDGHHHSGGQFVGLDHVTALRRFGYDARYLLVRPEGEVGFSPQFPEGREVPLEVHPADLTAEDVVVVGEMHALGALALQGSPARKVIHNQNPFYSFVVFLDLNAVRSWGCEAMICPSPFTAGMLARMGWDGPLHLVQPGVDPVFAAAPDRRDRPRIAAIPNKRHKELTLIRGLVLSQRPDLGAVAWGEIAGLTRPQVALAFGACDIFLSLSHNEGLGLPPLEAMAAGCLVVGFHGQAGRDYATAENGDWFEDGEHFEIAQALIARLDQLAAGERFAARREAGRRTAAAYSQARFEAELAQTWRTLVGPP